MTKNHLKRIATPKTWPILRKSRVFVMRPNAGKVLALSLPLGYIIKEQLVLCDTTREVKKILNLGHVTVNGNVVKDFRYPVGLYETVQIIPDNMSYRLSLSAKGILALIPIKQTEIKSTLQQVKTKNLVSGSKVQVGLLNGRTVLLDKASSTFKVGDTVLFDTGKVTNHYSFQKGMLVQFIGGRHVGSLGTIEQIAGSKIVVVIDGKQIETLKKYALVVGEKSPALTISA